MKKELKELIEERKQEALEEKFFEKGKTVARYLGSLKELEYADKWSDEVRMCLHDEFEITVKHTKNDNFGYKMDMIKILARTDDGKFGTVYESHMENLHLGKEAEYLEVDGYIPGKWRENFKVLHQKAQKVEQEVQKKALEELKEKEAQDEIDQLRRFGLLGYLKDGLKGI